MWKFSWGTLRCVQLFPNRPGGKDNDAQARTYAPVGGMRGIREIPVFCITVAVIARLPLGCLHPEH
ncbi:hypothetical protein AXG53_16175 [Stenotrophomonas sp. KCTC 12332]|nr:hypothetical protein AXG53_16175 [Stenotrophomonas sp. KCTC 12332]